MRKPEYVENFMLFIAEEFREIMAKLGVRTVNELVGRTDKIKMREKSVTKRAETIDLSSVIGECAPVHWFLMTLMISSFTKRPTSMNCFRRV